MSPIGQPTLFTTSPPLVAGLEYQDDFLSAVEEASLLEQIKDLPFAPFEFHGYLGKRRVVSFGWRYDRGQQNLREAAALPAFLLPLRARAAAFAKLREANIQHALVTEYSPGAGIGWHKDKKVFDQVIGISLLSACTMRFRQKAGKSWKRASFVAEPRSAYMFKGPVRAEWEHSIAPVQTLRYSITFRSIPAGDAPI
jgi:alkylated DNA repair dioxygenase AlkB